MNNYIKRGLFFLCTVTLWHGPYLCPYIEDKTISICRKFHFKLDKGGKNNLK